MLIMLCDVCYAQSAAALGPGDRTSSAHSPLGVVLVLVLLWGLLRTARALAAEVRSLFVELVALLAGLGAVVVLFIVITVGAISQLAGGGDATAAALGGNDLTRGRLEADLVHRCANARASTDGAGSGRSGRGAT